MRIKEFESGDLVVITGLDRALKGKISNQEEESEDYIGLICEVEGICYPILDRSDTGYGKCVLNYVWSIYAKLRPATSREKFLYKVYGIKKVNE